MPLKFSAFCALLDDLEDIELHIPPLIKSHKAKRLASVVEDWFCAHRTAVDALSASDATALLSAFLPEWRTDRVYGFQAPGLCRALGRLLGLGGARLRDLEAYRQPGRGDLADCLERVQRAGGAPGQPALMLGEVDAMLENQASRSRFSDRSIRGSSAEERNRVFGNVLLRASPVESKWLVRLLLKDFSPVRLEQDLVLKCFHVLLPDLLQFQHDFRAAVAQLKGPLAGFPSRPDHRSEAAFREGAALKLRPQIGVKVGRPEFLKCRSIDACMRLVEDRRWVLERKYDGEYCEVHIDLTKQQTQWIKIYSKSGRDSTEDRKGLHSSLTECLRLGQSDCKIRRQAILLGELVVYSDRENCILPFEKIRKHVRRSGVLVGAQGDSQPFEHEHLAIVLFDLLLWDDENVSAQSIEKRRFRLREICARRRGKVMSADWKIVDFSEGDLAKRRLIEHFAAANALRYEGLILKPLGVPYFALHASTSISARCIKLKKDYLQNMADEADFAVIGASFDAQSALKRGTADLKWTAIHLGCLMNKSDVTRFDARPHFRYVATIEDESCIPIAILRTINSLGPFVADTYVSSTVAHAFDLDIEMPVRIDTLFRCPFVVEVIGSGFSKPTNCAFRTLRHPRVKKLHEDRVWQSCISFQELQEQAEIAQKTPADTESQETKQWIEKIEQGCKKKFTLERFGSQRCETSTPEKATVSPPTSSLSRKRPFLPEPQEGGLATLGRTSIINDNSMLRPSAKIRRKSVKTDVHTTAAPSPPENHSPLKEITNQACVRPKFAKAKTPIDKEAGLHTTSVVSLKQQSSLHRPQRARTENICGIRCFFAATAVLLAPCIRGYLYVCEDLLSMHDITMVDKLEHWDRDAAAHTPFTEVVSESQSYLGLRKVILVERRRQSAVLAILNDVRRLNAGRLKDRIEIYDWRVLEDCVTHGEGSNTIKCHLVGVALFDDTLDRTVLELTSVVD